MKIGLGAGKKDFPKANVLRAMLLETKDQVQTGSEEDIWKLESNIDDCSGEVLGYTMDRLLAAGARDVCYAPIYMKKNRPAYMLHVLCDRRQIPAMEEIMKRIQFYLDHRSYEQIRLGAVVFSNVYGYLGQTKDAAGLIDEIGRYES